ncbi:hypothetical protein M9Y10_030699 [Tritrichomonas musculus]|uniref:Protein kinase domain-containing protein n=1 Tax=Tritrichomonas musculus TaxID=1915356 RepID=A0ABR2H2Q1_9EUKA
MTSLFLESKNLIRSSNHKLKQIIDNLDIFFVSKDFDFLKNKGISEKFKESPVIVIDSYEVSAFQSKDHHFFILFENTLLIIDQTNLSSLQNLFSTEVTANIYFLSNDKNIFDQKLNIQYSENTCDFILKEEIDNFASSFIIRSKTKQMNQISTKILYCISYLIIKSNKKLSTDRLLKYNNNLSSCSKITADDYIELLTINSTMSSVITLIYHIEKEEVFVVKKMSNSESETSKLKQRETDNYLKLNHPLLPTFIGLIENLNYIIIEFIKGQTLMNIKSIQIDDDDKITIIFELMLIIQFIHSNHFIYRDLKPNNIIIDENKHAVLIDFDRMINSDHLNEVKSFTADFSNDFHAPELNSGKISCKCDIYSIGKIMSYIINESGFSGDKSNIEKMINECTEDDPEKRISLSELMLDFYINYCSQIHIEKLLELYEKYFITLMNTKPLKIIKNIEIDSNIGNVLFQVGTLCFDELDSLEDVSGPLHYLSLASDQNNAFAQFFLSKIFMMDMFFDISKALHYLTLAAGNNIPDAQYILGDILFKGKFIQRDINKAVHYLTLAANQNNPDAQFKLGYIFYTGKFFQRDANKAIHYFSLAADQNHVLSQFWLGTVYLAGEFVACNVNKAI